MIARLWVSVLTIFLVLVSFSENGWGQVQDSMAVEGYVFNKANMKPIANAIVRVKVSPSNSNSFSEFSAATDNNGFYQLDPIFLDESVQTTFTMSAQCKTTKKTYFQNISLYNPSRNNTIYRRDLYMEMSQSISRCKLP